MAESTTTTALAVYSFTKKKPLKRLGLSGVDNTQLKQGVNERIDTKHVVFVITSVTLGEIDIA